MYRVMCLLVSLSLLFSLFTFSLPSPPFFFFFFFCKNKGYARVVFCKVKFSYVRYLLEINLLLENSIKKDDVTFW